MTALIVEDHAMVSEMLRAQLTKAGFVVDGVATTAGEGLALYQRHQSTLVLCDIRLQDGSSGIDMTRQLVAAYPSAIVVMVSAENEGHVVQEAYAAGAVGYVSKRATGDDLLETIAEAMGGVRNAADRHTYRKLIAALQSPHRAVDGVRLTPRERDVLDLMGTGVTTTAALAGALGITANSVRTHIEGCMRKTGAHSRAEIVARAYQLGLLGTAGRGYP